MTDEKQLQEDAERYVHKFSMDVTPYPTTRDDLVALVGGALREDRKHRDTLEADLVALKDIDETKHVDVSWNPLMKMWLAFRCNCEGPHEITQTVDDSPRAAVKAALKEVKPW